LTLLPAYSESTFHLDVYRTLNTACHILGDRHRNVIKNRITSLQILLFESSSFGLWRRVMLCYDTSVSEVHAASIFRMKYPSQTLVSYHNTTWRQNAVKSSNIANYIIYERGFCTSLASSRRI